MPVPAGQLRRRRISARGRSTGSIGEEPDRVEDSRVSFEGIARGGALARLNGPLIDWANALQLLLVTAALFAAGVLLLPWCVRPPGRLQL